MNETSITLRVLMVEHSEGDAAALLEELKRCGFAPTCERVETCAEMNAALEKQRWDLVIADYVLPELTALTALKLLKARGLDIPFIVISDAIGEDNAMAAMEAGAHDYHAKNDLSRLGFAIRRELSEAEARRACKKAEEALRQAHAELEAKVRALASANLQLKKMNNKLKEMSRTDPLTGLLNRRVILEMAASEWSRWQRYGTPFSVMIVDVDNFKAVNDRYGHLTGDRVLRMIANTINASLRGVDMVGRYGGEEFVVILPETGIAGALAAGQNLLKNIRKSRLRTDDLNIRVTASIGIAAVSRNEKNLDSLLHRADLALYTAKRQGKNRVIVDDQNYHLFPELFAVLEG
jgi:diguanylate cyclase (GGDEF)-like protein